METGNFSSPERQDRGTTTRRPITACVIKLLALLAAWLPVVAQAQFLHTTNNGTITITGYTGSGGDVSIPETINGLPVTSIESYAFAGISSLTSITISSSVSSIGYALFFSGTNLTAIIVNADNSVYSSADGVLFDKNGSTLIRFPEGKHGSYEIPSGVGSIGVWAFANCEKLRSVAIPDSVTSVGAVAFSGCTSLTNVTIPDRVTRIGRYAFSGCYGLAGVTIPGSVTIIGDYAFSDCKSLANLAISNGVTSIGVEAFSNCINLTNAWIGSGVTNIGNGAFYFCTRLTTVTVDADNSIYASVDGALYNKSLTTLIECPDGRTGNYSIPYGVTNIAQQAFSECIRLRTVSIPSTVTSFGELAFLYCTNLNEVYFEGNAPFTGSFAFDDDSTATVFYLPGTTGWGPTFGGRPTALWRPQVQTDDVRFGVRTNQFGFNIHWASGRTVVVEACEDLANPVWTPVGTNTLTEGSSYFSDPHWTNSPARFYRLREL